MTIDSSKISHSVDRNSIFKRPDNYTEIQYRDTEDEHLMVWYQTDAFADFIKLWGTIDVDLVAGTNYTLTINSTWDVTENESKKYVYLTETSFFGGNNVTFGVLYIIGGGVFLILAGVMVVLEILYDKNRKALQNRTAPQV